MKNNYWSKQSEPFLIAEIGGNHEGDLNRAIEMIHLAQEGGADAVSAINTVFGMSINIESRKPNINTNIGGLSGPAIKPIGVANVYKISKSVDIPIIGIGGITSAKDVVEYMLAGASAIQIGTANYRDVGIAKKILNDLKDYCKVNGIEKIHDITGKVKPNV